MTPKQAYINTAMRLAIDYGNSALSRVDALQALEDHLTEQLDTLLLDAYAEGRKDEREEKIA